MATSPSLFSCSYPEGISLEVRYILGLEGGVPRQFAELWFTTDDENEGNWGGKKLIVASGEGIEGEEEEGVACTRERAGPPAVQKELSLLLMAGGDSALPEGRERGRPHLRGLSVGGSYDGRSPPTPFCCEVEPV